MRVEAWRHQSSQDRCCGKGRWSLGQSPMPDAPDQGAVQTRVSATLSPAPHRMLPPAQWPVAPYSSSPEEHEPHSVLSSGLSATSHRVRTLDRGPKEVLKRWAPRVLVAHPARRLLSLLSEGLPHDHGRRLLGLQTLPGPRHCGAWMRDGGCRQGARNWDPRVCVGSAGSAGVKGSLLWGCVLVMGANSSVILFAVQWQRVFRWDYLLFPKAFWRIRYKRLKYTFTLSVFRIYWLTVTNSLSASRRIIRDMLTPKQSFK